MENMVVWDVSLVSYNTAEKLLASLRDKCFANRLKRFFNKYVINFMASSIYLSNRTDVKKVFMMINRKSKRMVFIITYRTDFDVVEFIPHFKEIRKEFFLYLNEMLNDKKEFNTYMYMLDLKDIFIQNKDLIEEIFTKKNSDKAFESIFIR